MNKYEKKIYEIAPNDVTIHELFRRPVRSPLFKFIDMMFDNIFMIKDSFPTNGAYFLLMDQNKAELVNITKDLTVSKIDVTDAVGKAAGNKSFEYDGHIYKIYRKLR